MSDASYRRKPHILFLGEGNRARSQMAEAYMRALGDEYFDVQSAGMETRTLDRRVVTVMAEEGIDIRSHRSKLVHADLLTWADLIITINGADENLNAPIPNGAREKNWLIADPVDAVLYDDDLAPFRKARDQVKQRVRQLINSVKLFQQT